jgi:flagellar biosynthesis/type III secretory pathway chaperone
MPIKAVIDKLEQLNVLHQQLLDMGQKKKTVLVTNQVNELALFINQESKLLKRVAETEVEWRNAIVVFLQHSGMKPDPSFTVSDIIKLVYNADDRRALTQSHQALMEIMGQLKDTNALNQSLIEQSLAFINHSMDLYMGDPGQDATYQNPSHTAAAHSDKRRMFDARG